MVAQLRVDTLEKETWLEIWKVYSSCTYHSHSHALSHSHTKIFFFYIISYKDLFFFHLSPDNRNTSCLSVSDNKTFTVEDEAWL